MKEKGRIQRERYIEKEKMKEKRRINVSRTKTGNESVSLHCKVLEPGDHEVLELRLLFFLIYI